MTSVYLIKYSDFTFLFPDGVALSDEKRLIKHLLDNYETVGKVGRPVYNTSQTISVKYGLALIQILDLDEKNQVLTTNCWSRYVSIYFNHYFGSRGNPLSETSVHPCFRVIGIPNFVYEQLSIEWSHYLQHLRSAID